MKNTFGVLSIFAALIGIQSAHASDFTCVAAFKSVRTSISIPVNVQKIIQETHPDVRKAQTITKTITLDSSAQGMEEKISLKGELSKDHNTITITVTNPFTGEESVHGATILARLRRKNGYGVNNVISAPSNAYYQGQQVDVFHVRCSLSAN